jgi:outer membrane protein assembly factor BamB
VCNGFREIAGYDFATGKLLWSLDGGGDIPVPTPVVAHDLIFVASAHGPRAPVGAIKPSAAGDLDLPENDGGNKHIAWWKDRVGVYMQTPIVVGDFLYGCRDNGVLICWHAKTGSEAYKERLGSGNTGFTASPIAAGDKLYFTSEEGDVHVVKAGDAFQKLAVNPLGEPCMATPATSDGALFFRTRGHLIAVREE